MGIEREPRTNDVINKIYLLFLSWWHELSVDDTQENVDNEEEKKFPADKLVQGSLHSQTSINFC